jgi:hypothetical protein
MKKSWSKLIMDFENLSKEFWQQVLPITGAFRFSTNYRACPKGTPADITDICVYRNMRYRFSTNSVVEERRPPA